MFLGQTDRIILKNDKGQICASFYDKYTNCMNCMTCLCQKSSNTGAYLQMQMIVICNENETVSPISEVMSTKSPRKPQIVLSCVG